MARAAMAKLSWEKYALRPVQSAPPASLPVFIYGTAWKKDQSSDLVYQALKSGFRAIDTAGQPKHYREDLVGDGVRRAIKDGTVRREDLHIQTKYTSVLGQSPDNMPYDPEASVTDQVHASIASSLHNLRSTDAPESSTDTYIDMLILHSPLETLSQTVEAWKAFESYVPHRIRNLGISNCTLPLLKDLTAQVSVPPAVVQNRFYPATRFDLPLRTFCRTNDILYQSFWTLTANPELAHSQPVQQLASHVHISPAAALYCLVMGLGQTTVLNGTKNSTRMAEDLAAPLQVGHFAQEQPALWASILNSFQTLTGDIST